MKVTRKVHGELMAARRAKRAAAKEKPLDRFVEAVCAIRDTLAQIQEAADNHFDLSPDEIHWGHVGDANRTLAGLKEILAVIRGEVK
ncbi:MAG: hypothetical protein KAY32_09670 [Candidatus Eisenbacteria sp.]|nr:hypothetical protein [Candidatus Eisenbacteria bacterium]